MKMNAPDRKTVVRTRRIACTVSSAIFLLLLIAMVMLSLDFAHRPSFSESEKRELAKFPKFSISALSDGDYFDDINLWFSDTFPFRDGFVKASVNIKKLLGVGQNIHHFSEGNADDIPDSEDGNHPILNIDPVVPDQNSNESATLPDIPMVDTNIPTNPQNQGDNVLEQNFDSIYIYGNTGYEYYSFLRNTADNYVNAINSAANEAAESSINFYNMIVPTSIDITLNDATRSKLSSSDQKSAINYMNGAMNGNVKKVPVYDLLKAHKDEYIYFRTDHHWTSLGAYYAYAQFMTVKGGKYEPLSNFTQYEFPGFLGSFYNDTGKNPELEKAPDTVYAYMPNYDIKFSMMQKGDSKYIPWPLISNVSNYSSSYKYLCFAGGDNPISVIENNSLENGETCVFVKESFGNAFAPYLACNYKTVYIIDYRYFNKDIIEFAKEKGATDIIVQNNISMTRNKSLVNKLAETL